MVSKNGLVLNKTTKSTGVRRDCQRWRGFMWCGGNWPGLESTESVMNFVFLLAVLQDLQSGLLQAVAAVVVSLD